MLICVCVCVCVCVCFKCPLAPPLQPKAAPAVVRPVPATSPACVSSAAEVRSQVPQHDALATLRFVLACSGHLIPASHCLYQHRFPGMLCSTAAAAPAPDAFFAVPGGTGVHPTRPYVLMHALDDDTYQRVSTTHARHRDELCALPPYWAFHAGAAAASAESISPPSCVGHAALLADCRSVQPLTAEAATEPLSALLDEERRMARLEFSADPYASSVHSNPSSVRRPLSAAERYQQQYVEHTKLLLACIQRVADCRCPLVCVRAAVIAGCTPTRLRGSVAPALCMAQ